MSKPLLKLCPLALAILLSGCAMKPDHVVTGEQFLPDEYLATVKQTESLAAEYANWHERYSDEELNRLISLALYKGEGEGIIRNPDVAKASAQFLKARAFLSEADARRWPQLGLSVDGQKRSSNNGFERDHATSQQASGIATFELDLWSRLANLSEARAHEILASENNVQAVIHSVTHQIVSSYWTLRMLDAESELINQQIETREKQLEIVRNRYKLGIDTSLDVEKTLAKLASIQRNKLQVESQKALTERALALLTGVSDLKVSLPPKVPQPMALPLQGKPSQLLTSRADVKQSENMLKAAGFDIAAARAALFPQISLVAQGGAQGTALTSLNAGGSSFWTLGFTLDIPLFDRGLRMSQISKATAIEQERVADYQKVIQSAFADVNNAIINLNGNTRQKPWIEKELNAANRSVQIATAQYQAGLIGYSDVLDTQQAMDDAKRDRSRLHYQELIHQADLMHAIGL